jgi:glycosyltransferase involved in cell wall biosynthesis
MARPRSAGAEESRRRTVLVIAGEFPPVKTIGRIRTAKFAGHLQAFGWNVVVLTVAPNGNTIVADPALAGEVPPGATVARVGVPDLEGMVARGVKRLLGRGGSAGTAKPGGAAAPAPARPVTPAPARPGLLDRLHGALRHLLRYYLEVPDSYNLWAWRARHVAERLCAEHQVDIVYTTLPPFSSAWLGYYLRKRRGLPWVADYRDLWTGDVLREWLPPWRTRVERWIERRLISHADAVITVSEQKTEYVRRLIGPSVPRWDTITNGYDVEEFAGLRRARQPDGNINFVFTGRLFKNRCGYAFFEALGELKRERPELASRARIRFLGGVSPEIRARFDALIERYGLHGQFDFPGDVPFATAKQAQVDADYLLLIVDTGATSDGVIPGKLFEYVAARRPIFALTDPGATATIIRDGGMGVVVDAEDAAGCRKLLEQVLAQPVPEVLVPDEAYLRQFDRRRLAERLAALFDQVVAGRDTTTSRRG